MTETELKFVLDETAPRALRGRLKALEIGPPQVRNRTLRSVYYDTPDHRLRHAGIALRLRRDGRRWLQTVKARTSINGGLLRTEEVEVAAPGGRLDIANFPGDGIRQELEDVIGKGDLVPVCEARMKRGTSILDLPGGARVELAIDEGEIVAGEAACTFREAELELLEGDLDALYDLTEMLLPDGGLHLSTMSKSERGYLLAATGEANPPPAPRSARKVPLDTSMTSEIAARDVLRECFEQITANIDAVLTSHAPEGSHQLRIGLRRLRAAFGIFRPVISNDALDRLNVEAREIGRHVGALRDLDVLIADVIGPEQAAHPHETGFAPLLSAVETRREAVRADLRDILSGRRVQKFQIDLARFIETRGWLEPEDFGQTARLARPVGEMAGKALEKRWKSARRHARGIAHLSVERRHELRKELKKLRYAIEFLGPLYGRRKVAALVDRMKRLQDLFGDLNDLAMAEDLLCRPDSPGAGNAAAQRAVGRVLGARAATAEAAWSHAKALWRDVERAGPFWR